MLTRQTHRAKYGIIPHTPPPVGAMEAHGQIDWYRVLLMVLKALFLYRDDAKSKWQNNKNLQSLSDVAAAPLLMILMGRRFKSY